MKNSIMKLLTAIALTTASMASYAAPSPYTETPVFTFEVGGSENSRDALATLESGHWRGLSASFGVGLSKGKKLPSVTEGQLYLNKKWEGAYRNADRQMHKELGLHYTLPVLGHNTKFSAIYGENHGHYKGVKVQTAVGIFTPYLSYTRYVGESGVDKHYPQPNNAPDIIKTNISRDANVVRAGFKTTMKNGLYWTIGAEKVVSGDEKSSVVPTATLGWSVELK